MIRIAITLASIVCLSCTEKAAPEPDTCETQQVAQASSPSAKASLRAEAFTCIRKHQFKTAKHILNKALADAPNDPIVLNNLGLIQLLERDRVTAVETLARSRQYGKDDVARFVVYRYIDKSMPAVLTFLQADHDIPAESSSPVRNMANLDTPTLTNCSSGSCPTGELVRVSYSVLTNPERVKGVDDVFTFFIRQNMAASRVWRSPLSPDGKIVSDPPSTARLNYDARLLKSIPKDYPDSGLEESACKPEPGNLARVNVYSSVSKMVTEQEPGGFAYRARLKLFGEFASITVLDGPCANSEAWVMVGDLATRPPATK